MKDCFCMYICCRVIIYLVTDHSIIKHLTRKRKDIKRLGRPVYKPRTILEITMRGISARIRGER